MSSDKSAVHPVQTECCHRGGQCPQVVTRAAYEVYCHVFGPQPAMMEGNCRGGFSQGELIGFLYARGFPRAEWRIRFDEAISGAAWGRR